jgi:hypothetical protein
MEMPLTIEDVLAAFFILPLIFLSFITEFLGLPTYVTHFNEGD